MQVANKIQNFATEEELVLWTTALTSANSHIIKDNDCHGVSEDHILYDWFVANCFEKIKSVMDDDKLKVMFGMYLNETRPWKIHTDAYHVLDYPGRQTAKSFLMPLSVDNRFDLVSESRTIVFNEYGKDNNIAELSDNTLLASSAINIYDKHLSHNSYDTVKKFTVQGEYQWQRGSLIWWDGNYFHDTDNFIANGYTSKQAIVVHTYYD